MMKILGLASILLLLNGCAAVAAIPLPIKIASNIHTVFTIIKKMDDNSDNNSWKMVSLRIGQFQGRSFGFSSPAYSYEVPVHSTDKPNMIEMDGDKSLNLAALHRLVDEQLSNVYVDEHNRKKSGI